jgi:hypothetical protein
MLNVNVMSRIESARQSADKPGDGKWRRRDAPESDRKRASRVPGSNQCCFCRRERIGWLSFYLELQLSLGGIV